MTITTRAGKGSPLTNAELDANWADIIAARSAHLADTANPHATTKAQVGLGNVDNTSDATKNAAVATLTNKTLTAPVINSPTGLVKADVGLGNVDNTSDVNKPVSTATTTQLNLKVNTSAIVNDLTTGGTTVPLSAQQGVVLKGLADTNATNIALKANSASPSFTGIMTSTGASIITANAMGALVVDVTKGLNTKTVGVDSTLTFSATPAADTQFALHLTNSDTASHTITIPSSFSLAQQTAITTVTLPASGQLLLKWRYTGSIYTLIDDVRSVGSSLTTWEDIPSSPYTLQAGDHAKNKRWAGGGALSVVCPASVLSTGFYTTIVQDGAAGNVTINNDGTSNVVARGNLFTTSGGPAEVRIELTPITNVFLVSGELGDLKLTDISDYGKIARHADVAVGRAFTSADFLNAGAGIVPLNAVSPQAFTIPTAATMGITGSGNILIVQCLGAAHTIQYTGGGGGSLNSGILTVTSNTATLAVGNTYTLVQRGSTDVWDLN